jgi:hypothetical protein
LDKNKITINKNFWIQTLFYGLLLLFYIYLVRINFFVPLFADDIARSQVHHNILHIFKLTSVEYFSWTGRVFVTFLTYLFLWKGTIALLIFNLLNPLMLLLLFFGVFLLAYNKFPEDLQDIIIFFLLTFTLWFLLPVLGENIFWKTGAIGYLWMVAMTLWFVYPYKKLLLSQQAIVDGWVQRLVFFVVGVLLGTGLEILSIPTLMFLIGTVIYLRWNKLSIPYWAITGLCGYLLGLVILISAPGNYHRMSMGYLTNKYDGTLINKLLIFTKIFFVHYLSWLTIIAALMLVVLFMWGKLRSFKASLLNFGLAFLAFVSLIGVKGIYFVDRLSFVGDVAMLTALASLIPIQRKIVAQKHLIILISGLLIILGSIFINDLCKVYKFYSTIAAQETARERMIKANVAKNIFNIKLPAYYFSKNLNTKYGEINSKRYFVRDITSDPNNWVNKFVAKSWNLKTIVLED